MKKNIKKLIVTITVMLALIGATGLTAFAAGYITWPGSDDYIESIENIDEVKVISLGLKDDNKAKEKEINELNKEIKELEKIIEKSPDSDQMKQAEEDMKDIKKRTEDLLDELD